MKTSCKDISEKKYDSLRFKAKYTGEFYITGKKRCSKQLGLDASKLSLFDDNTITTRVKIVDGNGKFSCRVQ